MVESIGSYQPIYFPQNTSPAPRSSLNNFDVEDRAIISAQAKILNELEKFNAGTGSAIDLALANTMGKRQVEAACKVIETKTEMMDTILKLGDDEE